MTNVFTLETPKKQTLAFTTQGGHISGELMKNINFRRPEIIQEFKKLVLTNNNIGSVIEVKGYFFIVIRKHYNSKVDETTFRKAISLALSQISGGENFKTTNEDWPQFQSVIKELIPNIEFRDRSGWPNFI